MKLTKKHFEILDAPGLPGREQIVSNLLEGEYKSMGYKVVKDNIGSIFAFKKSKTKNAPKVMFAAHMDEVGFAVKKINAMGLVELNMLGGIWTQTIQGTRVILTTRDGKQFKGAIIATSNHLLTDAEKTKPIPLTKMLADFGFTSPEDAKKKGVMLQDQITYDAPAVMMENNRLLAKAIDNRMGCIVGLELLKNFKDIELPFDLYVGATVQEEVGTRGAYTASALINPDFAIVCDVSAAQDTTSKEPMGQIGGGTMLRLMDRLMITPKHLLEYQEKLAKKAKVKTQYYISPGGTDGGAIQRNATGTPVIQCAMVARSIHNNSAVMDMNDAKETVKMVSAIFNDFDAKTLADWKSK